MQLAQRAQKFSITSVSGNERNKNDERREANRFIFFSSPSCRFGFLFPIRAGRFPHENSSLDREQLASSPEPRGPVTKYILTFAFEKIQTRGNGEKIGAEAGA